MPWSFLIITVGIYLGLNLLLSFYQSRLVYLPLREIEATPDAVGLSYEDVRIEVPDAMRLHGWYIPADQPRGVILFCHGNAGNISHRLESITIFNQLGLSVLIFDYRGYGLSQGRPSEKGTYQDAEAAWDYLVRQREISPERIIIFGRSLGGPIAARTAGNRPARLLILESTFTSLPEVASKLFPGFPVKWISRYQYKTCAYLQRITCPVLVIHSPEDDVIPYSLGLKLFKKAGRPKDFLEIRGGHNEGFLLSGKAYRDGLQSFLGKY